MEHSAHLAPLLATDVHAAEAQIRAEMGFPAALAELYYHTGQSGSHGFQWESFSELGEWCICTRRTQQPHECGTPARDGRFRGTGLQPSGSDQPRTCADRIRCKRWVLSRGILSPESRKLPPREGVDGARGARAGRSHGRPASNQASPRLWEMHIVPVHLGQPSRSMVKALGEACCASAQHTSHRVT